MAEIPLNEQAARLIVDQECYCDGDDESCAPCDFRNGIVVALDNKDLEIDRLTRQTRSWQEAYSGEAAAASISETRWLGAQKDLQQARKLAATLRDNLEHSDRFGQLMQKERDALRAPEVGMFMFGSMRHLDVLTAILCRPIDDLRVIACTLPDHRPVVVEDASYPALKYSTDATVVGELVYGLTPADLERIAFWEDDEYGLATMAVYDANDTPHAAHVHATTSNLLTDDRWHFDVFAAGVDAYLPEVRAWMAEFKSKS